ncbi:MAG: BON domain-containing protein, partial [Maritimibacter sp.]
MLISAVFIAAALLALVGSMAALVTVETVTRNAVERTLFLEGAEWAEVETNGLQVLLTGTAPDEPTRFKALSAAGHVVDSGRVIDHMEVKPPREITPPRFTIEMLRNEAGISMIGLIPAVSDRDALSAKVAELPGAGDVTDLLQTADYPEPENWQDALDYALRALKLLPRSKISISADRVAIVAISDSAEQKASWEKALKSNVPGGMKLVLDITAPRPVITPFTLRFLIDDDGARFDACTAHTEQGRDR